MDIVAVNIILLSVYVLGRSSPLLKSRFPIRSFQDFFLSFPDSVTSLSLPINNGINVTHGDSLPSFNLSLTPKHHQEVEEPVNDKHVLLWTAVGLSLMLQLLLVLAWIYFFTLGKSRDWSRTSLSSEHILDIQWQAPLEEECEQSKVEIVRIQIPTKLLVQHDVFDFEPTSSQPADLSSSLSDLKDLKPSYSWIYKPDEDAVSFLL